MAIYGHNFDVFVGTYVDGDGTVTASSLTANQFGLEDMSTGKLVNGSGGAISATNANKFRVVKFNEAGSYTYSPVITFGNIYKGDAVEAAAGNVDVMQVNNIGYHGTGSDSIELVNSNRYSIRLVFDNDGELYSQQKDQYFFEYVSDADAKQIEIANDFAQKMSAMPFLADGSTNGAKRAKVKVERFIDASTESATASVTGTFTQGSTTVTFSGTHNVAVGDYIRQATGVAQPVYKCVEVIATDGSIVIDQPYQATSETTGSGDVKRVTKANAEAANAGLKITGLDTFHKVGLYPHSVVSFKVTLDGFGNTENEEATAPVKGECDGRAIADMEWFAIGTNAPGGAAFSGGGHPSAEQYATLDAAEDTAYDTVTLNYYLDNDVQYHAIAPGGKVQGTIVMAISDTASGDKTHLDLALSGVDGIGASDLTAGS